VAESIIFEALSVLAFITSEAALAPDFIISEAEFIILLIGFSANTNGEIQRSKVVLSTIFANFMVYPP
jgi:hypothetical protein